MSDSQIDPKEFRNTLGSFVTGVTIVTTIDAEGRPYGLTANSFSSVSLDPPLVLWSQALKAPSHSVFRDAERFSISILAQDQIELSNKFSRGGEPKFDGVNLKEGLGGIPLIEGCSATLECKRIAAYPGGDHLVFLGEVERIERSGRPPLGFYGGRYVVPLPYTTAGIDGEPRTNTRCNQAGRIRRGGYGSAQLRRAKLYCGRALSHVTDSGLGRCRGTHCPYAAIGGSDGCQFGSFRGCGTFVERGQFNGVCQRKIELFWSSRRSADAM